MKSSSIKLRDLTFPIDWPKEYVGFHVDEFEDRIVGVILNPCSPGCEDCGATCSDCGAVWEFHGLYWGNPSHGITHEEGCSAVANMMAECELERLSPGIMAVRELELKADLPW